MKDLKFKTAGEAAGTQSACAGEPLAGWALIEELSKRIQLEDLQGDNRRIAEVLGVENFLKLVKLYSGQTVYIPNLLTLCLNERNREIRRRFTGHNYNQLARDFGLSGRQIRKIINNRRR